MKMSAEEVTKYVDARVDKIYKDAYANGFRDGAESQRKVFENVIKFNRGNSSWAAFKEAEQKLIESQKKD